MSLSEEQIGKKDKHSIPESKPSKLEMLNSNSFGLSYHVYRRDRMPRTRKFRDLDLSRWDDFAEGIQNDFTVHPDDLLSWETWKPKEEKYHMHSMILHLQEGITLFMDESGVLNLIRDHESDEEAVEEISRRCKELVRDAYRQEVGVIMAEPFGMDVKFVEFKAYEQDLMPYMPDEIRDFREQMVRDLTSKDGSGLYLLHGEPGTGKTSFIKSLIPEFEGPALFITPAFAQDLASAELLPVLSNYPNGILIIEDAEMVLMKRAQDNASAVSSLLNLSDGFLSDYLNLKIICTFNTRLDDIDPALTRKGRLRGMQEFRKLNTAEAERVTEAIGKEAAFDKPVTLAEVCNRTTITYSSSNKNIGI